MFRAYWLHRLADVGMSPTALVLSSALAFSVFHAFLGLTGGGPASAATLHAFVAWEGAVCAALYLYAGLLPATLCHGVAIFLLSNEREI